MSNSWPVVVLNKVLTPISRLEILQPDKEYRILGAHWYAKGLYVKDIKSGSQIKADRAYRVEAGDFVYNRLFAWMGSFAVATNEQAGCYVSGEFPCFRVKQDVIVGEYLQWYFSRTNAWTEALGLSSGATPTSRNRLKEEKLLAMSIPLPPITEQRRIVARIEQLAGGIEEARRLRRLAMAEVSALIPSYVNSAFSVLAQNNTELLKQVVEIGNGQGLVKEEREQSGKYAVYGSGGEVGRHTAAVRTEPFVVIGRKGSAGKVTFAPNGGWVTDTAYYAYPLDDKQLDYRFLFYALSFLDFSEDVITTAIPGVNRTAIYAHSIPVPPLEEQRRIVAYLDDLQAQVDGLKQLQAQTQAELDALLPSVLDKAFKGEL